mmetsp:Transcript_42798/g.86097  ORF Transcript_42798/g.86097 Transcript_42798/m.86097 type:complete len:287 (+) Transcript_42798:270-1130(+)
MGVLAWLDARFGDTSLAFNLVLLGPGLALAVPEEGVREGGPSVTVLGVFWTLESPHSLHCPGLHGTLRSWRMMCSNSISSMTPLPSTSSFSIQASTSSAERGRPMARNASESSFLSMKPLPSASNMSKVLFIRSAKCPPSAIPENCPSKYRSDSLRMRLDSVRVLSVRLSSARVSTASSRYLAIIGSVYVPLAVLPAGQPPPFGAAAMLNLVCLPSQIAQPFTHSTSMRFRTMCSNSAVSTVPSSSSSKASNQMSSSTEVSFLPIFTNAVSSSCLSSTPLPFASIS